MSTTKELTGLLEPAAERVGHHLTAAGVLDLSTAISMKRIADALEKMLADPTVEPGEWVEWDGDPEKMGDFNGKPIPLELAPDTWVEYRIRRRHGGDPTTADALDWTWHPSGTPMHVYDIVAYRRT